MANSIDAKPPWVREGAVRLECGLFHAHDIRPPGSDEITNTLMLGLIKRAHVRESVMTDDGTRRDRRHHEAPRSVALRRHRIRARGGKFRVASSVLEGDARLCFAEELTSYGHR
ncbi:hypothetical protein BV22DRAFT_428373 [Leucogyrophana mollusca]|uniref:Uncharacterized protein n=1 Tax=Leucogyrophana mollusca TaxID=85980 RepID=A0ACB8BJU3_9AGAM|nr:hypothetical protein BV22DRAFT_428373 [Leucogyrophana mollusca]